MILHPSSLLRFGMAAGACLASAVIGGVAAADPLSADPPAVQAAEKTPPKLIVAISVDQFSGDLFAEYRQYYRDGLRRLSQGVVFPRAYQSHAVTETCPGHSTILTGSRPSRTGIVANNWIDPAAPRADKNIYCAEDERQPGSDSSRYVVSPNHLRVPTLGGRMKAAIPATRVVTVAGKDRAAVMMGGPAADESWWLSPEGYVSYPGMKTPAAVARVNAQMRARLGEARPAMPLPEHCRTKAIPVPVGAGKVVGTGRFARKAGDYTAFRISPEQDALTLDLAAVLIEDMRLGRQAQTDIISIGLSANDYIGHTYGTAGSEMCLQQFALDRALGAFFDQLDRDGIDYAVMLTADHGGHDLPERHRMNAMPMEQRAEPALTPKALSAGVASKTGLSGELVLGDTPSGDYYFASNLTSAQREAVEAAARAILRAHPQVQTVFTKAEIAAAPPPSGPPESWTLLEQARAGFDAVRSGDLLVLLKPRVMAIVDPVKGSVAAHGGPWDTDRRVPLLFWRKGLRGFEQPLGVETVDIMPSLAALIGLKIPVSEVDGRCLDLLAGPVDSCR